VATEMEVKPTEPQATPPTSTTSVPISYLADLLGVLLTVYTFGGCCGSASLGATINYTYTLSAAQYGEKPVQSIQHRIVHNYTREGAPEDISYC